jgi:enoyl-CoA hydratase/carnithine racemase
MAMVAQQTVDEAEVLTRIEGHIGIITLNRPKALNSINLEMIRLITEALKRWEKESQIKAVVIEGAGEKAFCAGGDIRSVYYARHGDDWELMDHIFREEYQLNYYISCYPKPYISLIQGICMGGGMGLSIHGQYRVVTDNTVMAMPETGIGFFPDIGASYFLNRCPGEIGMYLGVIGERIDGLDALYCGLATHYVPQAQWEALKKELLQVKNREDVSNILQKFHLPPSGTSKLASQQSLIDSTFKGKNFDAFLKRMQLSESSEVQNWFTTLLKKSPTSVKLSFTLLRKAKKLSLAEALVQEFRLSQACMKQYDFFEGVRALLVDKDNKPEWQPSRLELVTAAKIKSCFTPLGEKELKL